jgi:hypothetical protein
MSYELYDSQFMILNLGVKREGIISCSSPSRVSSSLIDPYATPSESARPVPSPQFSPFRAFPDLGITRFK